MMNMTSLIGPQASKTHEGLPVLNAKVIRENRITAEPIHDQFVHGPFPKIDLNKESHNLSKSHFFLRANNSYLLCWMWRQRKGNW